MHTTHYLGLYVLGKRSFPTKDAAEDVTAVTSQNEDLEGVTAVTPARENRFAQRRVDAHHIEHWADGGATSLDNLVQLCRRHHRLVHEGGFGVERTADGDLRFTRPDGRVIDEHPRMPAASAGGLHDAISSEGEAPIDATEWIIPEGGMDLDLVLSGLMQRRETRTPV